MFSDSLRNHVAGSVARAELLDAPASPVGRWLVAYEWVFPPMAVAAVVVELASPIALVKGRLRDIWVASAWLMHVSIALLMYVVFPYPLFLVAFAPFYDLEHLTRVGRGPEEGSAMSTARSAPHYVGRAEALRRFLLSGRRDLNPRPPAPKAGALPLRHSP